MGRGILQGSGLSVTMPLGETRQGEEVRDGPYDHNRGGGNRGGVAPATVPLLMPRAGILRGSGLYNALGRALHPHWRGLRFALSRKGERQTDAPPSPSLAVIEAQAISEVIIHLEYKEITHLGYALPPSSAVQSGHY